MKKNGYYVFSHDLKVAIPGRNKYYYPDVFATKEEGTDDNTYIQYKPEIIVEVVSGSTNLTDYVDKYIDYTKIPSLEYYLIVEPETISVTVHERGDNNNWVTYRHVETDTMVSLPKLGIEFLVGQVYA